MKMPYSGIVKTYFILKIIKNMEYIFKFDYVVYNFEDKSYLQHHIKAKNIKVAFIKFVAECNGVCFLDAKHFINSKMGSGNWRVENAIALTTPLGSSNLSLYDLRSIKKLQEV